MPTITALIAHAPEPQVRALLARVFTEGGWRVTEGAGTLVVERGSRGKTLLLGGAAGEDFYLRQTLTLEPGEHDGGPTTAITYPTSSAAITRGGPYGADREMRLHDEFSQRITTALREAGVVAGLA
ncbi:MULTISPECIES: hypothetical protein [unclassified Actinomyces]|uniref:hypothetical protein n=1 Tax=unclassified Actinomyces TaxID=2609248 RepID=UPI0020181175|nr:MULTISPECIES: hypothetical protein [unclassified Actinomyces]MCL3778497.1 hypothetical protein [Actinomyces sp. AC-20-1]MCL3789679.1 hypothetical protein [Actinomyces sp. 187325]MCL3792821.1 hypothetical protein [Actinomyces sp. 186855]MCL3795387.1 hypothetical protein [Actinomyces sp. 217892]